MPTLLLKLEGPLQAWGSGSRFATRQTETAPTKSGVLGLLAAAKGIRRTEPLRELASLRFGVRSDQPGSLAHDFQTARSLDGKTSMPLSHRYYLQDAVFLAALESQDSGLLEGLQNALIRPVFPLYLGRRAFPPSEPIRGHIVESSIEEAFRTWAWQATGVHRETRKVQEFVDLEARVDAAPGVEGTERLRDVPLSFAPERRVHAWRDVVIGTVRLRNPDYRGDGPDGTDAGDARPAEPDCPDGPHDVFAAFSGGD